MPRAGAPARTRLARLRALRSRVRELPGGWLIWRVAITVFGVAVIALGILLLPLPGPGWLIIFGGLGVLASEYTWAARLLKFIRAAFARWTQWVAARRLWLRVGTMIFSLAVLAAVVWAAWFLTGSPGL